MLNARRQAEDYAKALPATHGWPPFLIICDVGHCFELYADFTGQGKNYVQFPDRQRYRVYLDDLREPEVRARMAAIWQEPLALDPTRHAVRVTRKIAERLAAVSKALEREHDPEEVALFLMRCVFTMFAEDAELIPKDSFKALLRDCRDNPSAFRPLVEELWRVMDKGGYSITLRTTMRRFNGKLFEEARVFALERAEIGELLAAAEHDWKGVEPSIFGTMLEQALDPAERARLGAHYTPRAHVERLVVETVIAPLREDWRHVLGAVQQARDSGDQRKALALIEGFHQTLCETRVLDPGCGTGNFLHVTQELMKKLEGEVLDAAGELGSRERLGGIADRHVGPQQFLGMDTNRRAVAIADLVLWIGHLQWHFRTRGYAPREPILERLDHIYRRDAVLEWDGWPVPQWRDGEETLPNPRRPAWPEAEFIVGNPPFIGGKDIRARLGGLYAEALWAAHPQVNESADYVMYWWDRAAELLTRPGTKLRRFGLVTTNSITQVFQRRVVQRHLDGKRPISLLLAIPDHPWTRVGKDTAQVRIAMTVAAAGRCDGRLREVISEASLDSDQPRIELNEQQGRINADLTIGTDVTLAQMLRANDGLCSPGVKLHGSGFLVTSAEAQALGLGRRPGLEDHIRFYRNGRDLTARPRDVMAIDLFGLAANDVRERFPEIYQHVKLRVKEEKDSTGRPIGRDANSRRSYRDLWWVFGEPRKELRPRSPWSPALHRHRRDGQASLLPVSRRKHPARQHAGGNHALGRLPSRCAVIAYPLCLGAPRRRLARHRQRPTLFEIPLLRSLPVSRNERHAEGSDPRSGRGPRCIAQAGARRASRADADQALQRPGGNPVRRAALAGRGRNPQSRPGANPERVPRSDRCRGHGSLRTAGRCRRGGDPGGPGRAKSRKDPRGETWRGALAQAGLSAAALRPGCGCGRTDRCGGIARHADAGGQAELPAPACRARGDRPRDPGCFGCTSRRRGDRPALSTRAPD
jgi:SAM-dependent methyltransferase